MLIFDSTLSPTTTPMSDIRSPRLLYAKGALLLSVGILASALLLVDNPSLKSAALLGVAVWAFCRSYYFAFYVIEHYIDRKFRYAGLWDFLSYLIRKRRQQSRQSADSVEADNRENRTN